MFKLTKELFSNIAQIIIVVLILPSLCLILSKITSIQNAISLLLDILGEIEFFDTAMDFVSAIVQMYNPALLGDPDLYLTHVAAMLETLDTTMLQLLSVSLCVRLCNFLPDITKWNGLHILTSVAGVVIGYFIVAIYDMPIMASLFLFLLVFAVDMIFVQRVDLIITDIIIKYLKVSLKLTFQMLITLFMTGYIAILMVISQGGVSDIDMIVFMICMFAIPWFVLSALDIYLLGKKV